MSSIFLNIFRRVDIRLIEIAFFFLCLPNLFREFGVLDTTLPNVVSKMQRNY